MKLIDVDIDQLHVEYLYLEHPISNVKHEIQLLRNSDHKLLEFCANIYPITEDQLYM